MELESGVEDKVVKTIVKRRSHTLQLDADEMEKTFGSAFFLAVMDEVNKSGDMAGDMAGAAALAAAKSEDIQIRCWWSNYSETFRIKVSRPMTADELEPKEPA